MSRVAFEIFGLVVHWYGLIIASAVIIGVIIAMKESKRVGIDQELTLDFALFAIPAGIIGARIYYVIFKWGYYGQNLGDVFKVWEGGLAIYGGVIGGVIAALVFARIKKINIWTLMDIVAPSLILGQAIGRWGNFFNQEAFGRQVTSEAWQWFPFAVYIQDLGTWHLATFFYESMWNLIVFGLLMWLRGRKKIEGTIVLAYAGLYGIGRFFIEGLRTDSLYIGTYRVSQLLSIVLIIASLTVYIIKKKRTNTLLEE